MTNLQKQELQYNQELLEKKQLKRQKISVIPKKLF